MPTFGFKKNSTGNLLLASVLFTCLFLLMLYAREVKIAVVFLVIAVFLWTLFAQEVRLEQCK
jgi:hypothetical protein